MNYLKYNFILTILLVIVNASLIKAQCGILPTVTVNVSGSTTIRPTDSVIPTAIPAGLNYLWSNGATMQSIIVSQAGGYSVQVTYNDCPTIITTTSDITSNSANVGGNISTDGGCTVTDRGVVWSFTPTPTISDNVISMGSGVGTFSSSMTCLPPNKTYYLRAYTTNCIGTAYGNQLSFTTATITSYVVGGKGPAGGYIFYDKGSYPQVDLLMEEEAVMDI